MKRSNRMTNQELYEKMKEELPRYQIGFHQISLQKYQEVISSNCVRSLAFRIDGEPVDEKVIANHILQKGFQIWDTKRGLCSTTYFPSHFKAEKLNYKYYSMEQQVCNIIFAVPYFVTYEQKDYFLGNLSLMLDAGSTIIFNDSIPPEFIYGYYEKKTPVVYNPLRIFQFSEDLSFFGNENFWKNLSYEAQKQVLEKIFDEKRKNRALRLINNNRQLELLNCDSLTRFAIRQSRKQKRIYIKSMNH